MSFRRSNTPLSGHSPTDQSRDPIFLETEFEDPVCAPLRARYTRPLQLKPLLWTALRWLPLVVIVLGLYWVWIESHSSTLQSRLLTRYSQELFYGLRPGHTEKVRYPRQGPFDERMGYVRLPVLLDRLKTNGMQISDQAIFSQSLLRYTDSGFFPPYKEKAQAGLTIVDDNNQSLFNYRYPHRAYASFEEIPRLMVNALLFIENRELLNEEVPYNNPAIDWPRFIKAALFKAGEALNVDTPSMGGSTLATQIEKYRHSEDGVTTSITEKLRQMVSASVRVYQQGRETLPARQTLVLDYLNTVPLAAAPGFGEVNGIGDGLHVWFGADFKHVNYLLKLVDPKPEEIQQQGLALRQAMALMIAHRRPSDYLLRHRDQLARLTDSYLRLLRREGAISPELMESALSQPMAFRNFRLSPAFEVIEPNKGANVVRNRLVSLLGVSLYDLDRLDLTAYTTLDKTLQEQVTRHLRNLADENVARQNGLVGEYLLKPGQSAELRYSFTLFERSDNGNHVRVQTDNTNIPFDINEGSKLELGSTAKLRVLSTYLGVMAELHQRFAALSAEQRKAMLDPGRDVMSRWVLEQLKESPELTLADLLQRALDRRYSANPTERFFTGGGLHTFGNFKPEDNNRQPSVRESLQESINLPFVRMLRDIINYLTYLQWNDVDNVLKDDSDERRKDVLARFIEKESVVFLRRFWMKYQSKTTTERLDVFLSDFRSTPTRMAVVFRYLFPEADESAFAAFLRERLPHQQVAPKILSALYQQHSPDAFNLQDQGYLARVHPLELWVLGYLERHPNASFSSALEASREQRLQVYDWLLRTKAKNARDSRVRTMLEAEAFTELHRRWKLLGYPFEHLVPSLASALGSSGDRPAALAELMGIILNEGHHLKVHRITKLDFAVGTPYEVHLSKPSEAAVQVMHPEVARALKQALNDVVNKGTARRLQNMYHHADGTPLNMGGKTGTGDNRLVTVSSGQKIKSRTLSRTATLVFYLGDDHFGTLTAFVPGSEARQFQFTSALPAQLLKGMAPILEPYLQAKELQRLQREREREEAGL